MISTLEAKNAHPLLSKIPEPMWATIFHHSFDEITLKIANKTFDELRREDLPKKKRWALILLMLAFPEETVRCIEFAENSLCFSSREIFKIAAALGRLDLLKLLHDKAEGRIRYPFPYYQAFVEAAALGRIDILEWLLTQAPELRSMLGYENYCVLSKAFKYGHSKVLDWLYQQNLFQTSALVSVIQSDVHSLNPEGLYFAEGKNLVEGLEWLKQTLSDEEFDAVLTSNGNHFFDRIIKHQPLEVLHWFEKNISEERLSSLIAPIEPFRVFNAIIDPDRGKVKQNLDNLKWLAERWLKNRDLLLRFWEYGAFLQAVASGNLEHLQWLGEKSPKELSALFSVGGSYDAWGVGDRGYSKAGSLALANGKVESLKWLDKHAPRKPTGSKVGMISYHSLDPVKSGQFTHLEKWYSTYGDSDLDVLAEFVKTMQDLFSSASTENLLQLLNWLAKKLPYKLDEGTIENILYFAAYYGHLDIIIWLVEKAPKPLRERKNFPIACNGATSSGQLHVLQWLVAKEPALVADRRAFLSAVSNGNLRVLQWLAEKAPQDLVAMIKENRYEAFRLAVKCEHPHVMQWLVEKAPEDQHAMIEYIAQAMSFHGYLFLKWIEKQAPLQFNEITKPWNSKALSNSWAADGDYDGIEWLAEKANMPALPEIDLYWTVRSKDLSLSFLFLDKTPNFAHSEAHQRENGAVIMTWSSKSTHRVKQFFSIFPTLFQIGLGSYNQDTNATDSNYKT